jgi:hypothetical protein
MDDGVVVASRLAPGRWDWGVAALAPKEGPLCSVIDPLEIASRRWSGTDDKRAPARSGLEEVVIVVVAAAAAAAADHGDRE